MSRHPAKPPRRCELLGDSLLSQGSFYPLSDGLSIQHRLITKPDLVPARLVGLAVKHPFAFALDAWFPSKLRVSLGAFTLLGGDRPISNCPTDSGSRQRLYVVRLEIQYNRGSILQQRLLEYWRIHLFALLPILSHAASNNINSVTLWEATAPVKLPD